MRNYDTDITMSEFSKMIYKDSEKATAIRKQEIIEMGEPISHFDFNEKYGFGLWKKDDSVIAIGMYDGQYDIRDKHIFPRELINELTKVLGHE